MPWSVHKTKSIVHKADSSPPNCQNLNSSLPESESIRQKINGSDDGNSYSEEE